MFKNKKQLTKIAFIAGDWGRARGLLSMFKDIKWKEDIIINEQFLKIKLIKSNISIEIMPFPRFIDGLRFDRIFIDNNIFLDKDMTNRLMCTILPSQEMKRNFCEIDFYQIFTEEYVHLLLKNIKNNTEKSFNKLNGNIIYENSWRDLR